MRRTSARVGIPSRRAASDAVRSSVGTVTSVRVSEAKFTAEDPDLALHGHDHRQVVGVGEGIASILEIGEEVERFVKGELDPSGWTVERRHQLERTDRVLSSSLPSASAASRSEASTKCE